MKLKIVLCGIIFLCSCGEAKIIGDWVQPIPGMESQEQGLKLMKDGKAASINMNTLLYEAWKRDGNNLVLRGKSLGNGQTIDFVEEFEIITLNDDNLVLKNGEIEESYRREGK